MSARRELYYGDNLEILRKHMGDESIDLCYVDPPFNSKRNYNQVYTNIGKEDYAQAQAFVDTWTWNERAESALDEILSGSITGQPRQVADLVIGLQNILSKGPLLSYLVQMAQRIIEIHRVLKTTGSFYLHCDSTASHYLKIMCDAVFVSQGGDFKNEIIWKRTTAHSDAKRFGITADTILFYCKSDKYTWNQPYIPYSDEYLSRFRNQDPDGRRWQDGDITAKGLTGGGYEYEYKGYTSLWRVPLETMAKLDYENRLHFTRTGGIRLKKYLDEMKGMPVQSIWTDIPAINSQSKERLGYPTQKPEALLERIISTSSHEGDTVLDAFCGCGTSVAVAEKMRRQWVGIDITYQSIGLMLQRLEDSFGIAVAPQIAVSGIPKDLAAAKALATREDDRTRKEFEKWAVMTYSGNRALINEKKGADKGIDGIAYIINENSDQKRAFDRVIFSVKSGKTGPNHVRDLIGTVENENAKAGVLISMDTPTKAMEEAAARAGTYHNSLLKRDFSKIILVHVAQIIAGEKLQFPISYSLDVLKRASPKADTTSQKNLF